MPKTRILNFTEYCLNEAAQIISNPGDPWEYKKEGDKIYTRKKGGSWIIPTGDAEKSIKEKIFKDKTTPVADSKAAGKVAPKARGKKPTEKKSIFPKLPTIKDVDKSDKDLNKMPMPFISKSSGDKFRGWVNDTYPVIAKTLNLDRSGSHTNEYIRRAWVTETSGKTLGEHYAKASKVELPTGANPDLINILDLTGVGSDSTVIAKISNTQCAQFVNDFSDDIAHLGDAWHAHNTENVGPRVWTAFHKLDKTKIGEIEKLWKLIHTKGGGKVKGPNTSAVKKLVNELVPAKLPTNVTLKLGDIVGLYYPPSGHHEEAFYRGGAPKNITGGAGLGYFIDNNASNKKITGNTDSEKISKGKTLESGDAWGMNTHVGIVGALKGGKPIIFHNISGNVYGDPITDISGDGRIAWIRRPIKRSIYPSLFKV